MDLNALSNAELEHLLKQLPAEIRRREAAVAVASKSEEDDAEQRKRRVFADFQALAARQGVDLSKL